MIGEKATSEQLFLKYSLTNTNKFERGCLDIFNIDALDVGTIQKIKIGHNNKGFGASWFLDSVEIINYATLEDFFFVCGKWLDKKKDDGLLERELLPAQKLGELVQEDVEDDDQPTSTGSTSTSPNNKNPPTEKSSKATSLDNKIVSIKLIAGRNLASKDSNGLSDPFCVFELLDEKGEVVKKSSQTSAVVQKSLNPVWDDQIFRFSISADNKCGGIRVTCYDEDRLGKDFMGTFVITKEQLLENSNCDKWFPLNTNAKKDEVSGDICLRCWLLENKN